MDLGGVPARGWWLQKPLSGLEGNNGGVHGVLPLGQGCLELQGWQGWHRPSGRHWHPGLCLL